ncbi:MAG: LysR family transcriptional regulator [Erythrobacter sp.]|nr:LysR family transcriptional regulator [Erythrobacter sp.]
MDLRALRHFATLVRQASFVDAARELNITQPALSRSIKGLEDELGSRLIERHRNGCTATAAGELLLRDADAILRRAAALKHNMRAYARGDLGHLRFGAAPLPAALLLPHLLATLSREEPGLTLGVALGSVGALAEQLRHDRIEFFLCAKARLPRDHTLQSTSLFEVPLAWLARAGHPLAEAKRIAIEDLLRFPQANVRSDASTAHEGEPDSIYDLPVAIACDDYGVLLETIRHCDAVCLATSALLAANPGLVALDVEQGGPPAQIEIMLVQRRGRDMSPMAQAVLQRILG